MTVDCTLSEFLEVVGAYLVWPDGCDLANRIASFVSTGVNDGVPVNGS